MSDSILLIPAPEHREALLGDSPGGGRVPAAFVVPGLTPHLVSHAIDDLHLGSSIALVLRWRGVDDVMGCDRARRVIGRDLPEPEWVNLARPKYSAASLANFARAAALGRIVNLDADGREVTP